MEDIAAVVLEANGTFSVITHGKLGSGSAMADVVAHGDDSRPTAG
ncbi:hypothetical protein ACWGH8_35995 [Nonomuraea muscovyensis]|uniref:Uncharacterized protein n=1 Tax=Nonomuraea muscovyensis TaxID=1124761 RepID=A0A7X0BZT1_9ACTN|nr:hypothetical protein [Nonomuraea muscovyensis]MBB6345850.1 hypothetical protein [Nonomuraea muscovyensis]